MHKKIEMSGLDIPADDIECWERYPKHRWMYDMSRLLDAQHIRWSPFETELMCNKHKNMQFNTVKPITYNTGFIYTANYNCENILTEVYIVKGEIKLLRHINKITNTEITDLVGDIELRINAFSAMYFQKFSGAIIIESIANIIMSIRLRPEFPLPANTEVIKLVKRIYKKNDLININGLTDQMLHESLAS